MKTSARNCFEGKVAKIVEGAINDEITVSLPGGKEVVAVITKGSTKRLGLAEGKDVLALIKASFVILLDDAEGYVFSTRNVYAGKVVKVARARLPWKLSSTAAASR